MKELVNFEHFRIIKEAEEKLDAYLDSVIESAINEAGPKDTKTRLGAALGNPVKFIKIKNNAKKYQQALVQKALNNLDYEKKKQAAGGEVDKDKMEVLKQANAAKNQALADTASAISQRMEDLATNTGLKKVKTLAISKAKVAAAEIALKSADAEETKQLKVKIKQLNKDAQDAEMAIKDYEKDGGEQPAQSEQPAQTQEMPGVKDDKKEAIKKLDKEIEQARLKYKEVSNGNDVKAMTQAELKANELELKKAQLEGDKAAIKSATDAIARIKQRPVEAGGEGTKPEGTKPEGKGTPPPRPPKPEGAKAPKEDNTAKIAASDAKIGKLKGDKKAKEDSLGSKNHPDVLAIERQIKAEQVKKAELGGKPEEIASAKAALKVAQDDLKAAVAAEKGKAPKESYEYVGESFTDRFRRIMNNATALNESKNLSYWKDYEKDTTNQAPKWYSDEVKNASEIAKLVDKVIINDQAEASIPFDVDEKDEKALVKLATDYFKKFGKINGNIISAMLSQGA